MSLVHFRIDLLAPLCIGAGVPSVTADQTVVRDGDDRPIVPATTLKGAARDLVRVHAGVDTDVFTLAFGSPGRVASGAVQAPNGAPTEQATGGQPSAIILTDARCPAGLTPGTSLVRTVALNEDRVAEPGALAEIEVVDPWLRDAEGRWVRTRFEGTVRPSPLVSEQEGARAVGLVVAGLSAITALGARTTRGWGRVRIAIDPRGAELARAVSTGAAA